MPFLGDTPIQIVMCNLTKIYMSFPVSCQLSSLMHIHIDNRFGLKMKQTTEWLLLFFCYFKSRESNGSTYNGKQRLLGNTICIKK